MLLAPQTWNLFEVYFSSAVKDHYEHRLWIARESWLCPRFVTRDKQREKKKRQERQLGKQTAPNRLANSTKVRLDPISLRFSVSEDDCKQHDIDSDSYHHSIHGD